MPKHWTLPSDEEVKEFILNAGGGYGKYDSSSGIFDVEDVGSHPVGQAVSAGWRGEGKGPKSFSLRLHFEGVEELKFQIELGLRSDSFEILGSRVWGFHEKANLNPEKTTHGSQDYFSWELCSHLERSGQQVLDRKYRMRVKTKGGVSASGFSPSDQILVRLTKRSALPNAPELVEERSFPLAAIQGVEESGERSDLSAVASGLSPSAPQPCGPSAIEASGPDEQVTCFGVLRLSAVGILENDLLKSPQPLSSSAPQSPPMTSESTLDWELCCQLNPKLQRMKSRNLGCGRIIWESKNFEEPRPYVRLKKGVNPHLLKFLVEQVWGLKRPELLITVTGGAQDFELTTENKDELLQGLTEAAKSVGAWFVSGGTSAGVMKYMGEARSLYASHLPLIGIVPWGVVKGRQKMVHLAADVATERITDLEPVKYERAVHDHDVKRDSIKDPKFQGGMSTTLDANHSHFIMMYDGKTEKFGGETELRSEFEACMSHDTDYTQELLAAMMRLNMGWQGLNFKSIQAARTKIVSKIPALCVCVQGGPGSIQTVKDAVNTGTPVLLVKSSGKAADILSDAVLVTRKIRSLQHINILKMKHRERLLFEVLRWTLGEFEEFEGFESAGTQAARGVSTHKGVASTQTFQSTAPGFVRAPSADVNNHGPRSFDINNSMAGDDGPVLQGISFANAPREVVATIQEVLRCYEMIPALKPGQANDSESWEYLDEKTWAEVLAKQKGSLDMMAGIISAATVTSRCWVFDLDETNPNATDLDGSLLECVLHSWGRNDMIEKILERKLLLCVKWDRPDILARVLKQTNMKRTSQTYFDALTAALVEALVQDRVDSVQLLMANGAEINEFSLELSIRSSEGFLPSELRTRDIKESRWCKLMKSAKESQGSQHVVVLVDELRKQLKSGKQTCHTGVSDNRGKMMSYSELARARQIASLNQDIVTKQRWSSKTNLIRLSKLYSNLLGIEWRYRLGMMGPAMDLFLWSILMNRHNMAKFLWEKTSDPIAMALTACAFYRKMARLSSVKPEVKAAMMSQALEFEDIAVEVQSIAMGDDMEQAMEALESPITFWSGLTCFDIAVMSDSKRFVEQCCFFSSDKRWSGDLNPYQKLLGLPMEFWVICLSFTGGLLAPLILDYDLPPSSSNVRAPAQRRQTPVGYPDMPFKNELLRKRFEQFIKERPESLDPTLAIRNIQASQEAPRNQSHNPFSKEGSFGKHLRTDQSRDKCSVIMMKLRLEPDEYAHMTVHEKKLLWDPTFAYWQRLECFWQAPVTLFMVRAIMYTFIVIVFTNHITKETSATFEATEVVLCIWMGASVLREFLQFLEDGAGDYFYDTWNLIDFCTLSFFWIGMTIRIVCRNGWCEKHFLWDDDPIPEVSEGIFTDAVEAQIQYHIKTNKKGQRISNLPRQMFGACLFFAWLRLLHLYSVNKTLGPLVLALRRMTRDILTFLVIWIVMLMAFASLLHGGDDMSETCEDKPILYHANCWKMWWILRTYFQAYGEMFLDEMNDGISVIGFMLLLLMLQLVLNNTMFVAVITSTFQTVYDQSQREWMTDMYHLCGEFMRPGSAIPVPLNTGALVLDFIALFSNHKKVMQQVKEERESGLPETSWWRKQARLRHARFADQDIVPTQLRTVQKSGTMRNLLSTEISDLGSLGNRRGSVEDIQLANENRAALRAKMRNSALLERARARYRGRERAKAQQSKATEQNLSSIRDKMVELEREQLNMSAQIMGRLEQMEMALSQAIGGQPRMNSTHAFAETPSVSPDIWNRTDRGDLVGGS